MKVLLLGNYRKDKQYSMLGYERMLSEGLKQAGIEVQTIYPRVLLGSLAAGKTGIAKWLGYIDKYLLFMLQCLVKQHQADVVHVLDHSNSMYVACFKNVPTIVTCHDVLAITASRGGFPEVSVRPSGRILQRWIASGLRAFERYICVSEVTRQELLRELSIEIEKTVVSHNPLYSHFAKVEHSKAEVVIRKIIPRLSGPYLLHVGGQEWYKNRIGVLELFVGIKARLKEMNSANANISLVIVGSALSDSQNALVAKKGLADFVHVVGGLDVDLLAAFYSRAEALLFPSLAEGFGLPTLEALACDCPVITSDRAPFTEFLEDVALYIDPKNTAESVSRIVDFLENDDTRMERIAKGHAIVKRHSPQSHIAACLECYREVLER